METRRSKHALVVGVFIVLATIIFALAIFAVGGENRSFIKSFSVKVDFADINGLKVGNNVWFSGVKVGTVKKINLKSQFEIEVTLKLEEKVKPYIKNDAMAKIGSEGFLGNKIVIIYAGTASAPPISDDGFLKAQKDTLTNEDMLATLQSSNKNLVDITRNLKTATNKIAAGEGTIGRLINDSSLAKSLQITINDFKDLAANGKRSIANIEMFTEQLNSQNSSVNKLFADTALFDTIRNAVMQLQYIAANTTEFAINMNAFANRLDIAAQSLHDTTNTIGVLINDQQAAKNLQETIENLKSASKKLDEDLEAAQHNFLLRGYFKHKADTTHRH